jgi:hypothetical protein
VDRKLEFQGEEKLQDMRYPDITVFFDDLRGSELVYSVHVSIII